MHAFANAPPDLPEVLKLEVEHIHDAEVFSVEQNKMAADDHVLAVRRRRRQFPLQPRRARFHAPS